PALLASPPSPTRRSSDLVRARVPGQHTSRRAGGGLVVGSASVRATRRPRRGRCLHTGGRAHRDRVQPAVVAASHLGAPATRAARAPGARRVGVPAPWAIVA